LEFGHGFGVVSLGELAGFGFRGFGKEAAIEFASLRLGCFSEEELVVNAPWAQERRVEGFDVIVRVQELRGLCFD
jgi:hypothetical protein